MSTTSEPTNDEANGPTEKQSTTNEPLKYTYTSTKTSIAYTTAKALLASGEFETAMATIETSLGTVLSSLPPLSSARKNDDNNTNELHPALAPLYYLYGTTLLYSVEESGDAMMQPPPQPSTSSSPSENSPIESNRNALPGGATVTEDQAEDIQIAWENLESARTILSNLVQNHPKSSMYVLDLAQVHQRLGDLQKGNGNYANAVEDYKCALNQRMEVLGRFDRSVADCHYSLGMTYMLLASAVDETNNNSNANDPDGTMMLGGKDELRRKSILHYLTCGYTFAGLIQNLCGKSEKDMANIEIDGETLEPKWWEEEPKKKRAKPVHDEKAGEQEEIQFSKALKMIRDNVKDLKAADPENGGLVFDFKEVLDEIQETIDSSEESLKAVNDLSKMKAEREGEAEAEDAAALKAGIAASQAATTSSAGGVASAAAGTTTIGFGNVAASFSGTAAVASASASAGATIIGLGQNSQNNGSKGVITPATVGKPVQMMVVKKKKKVQTGDASKRVKTE